jgi:hypothetical protein
MSIREDTVTNPEYAILVSQLLALPFSEKLSALILCGSFAIRGQHLTPIARIYRPVL